MAGFWLRVAAISNLQINIIKQMEEGELESQILCYHFFFFINTKSGNREGQQIMSFRGLPLNQHFSKAHRVQLTFVDLFDSHHRTSQIENLKDLTVSGKTVLRVIICGGDGTISWVLNELVKSQLDLTKCAFGVIPIGTGNDFCRTIGWPSENFDFGVENFVSQMKQWMGAAISKYDIWDVSIETYRNGRIYDIKDCKQYQRQENSIKKVFANYVGMGLDARVVYTVQKIRTPYAFVNKVLYALVGFYNFFRPLKDLKRKILSFTDNSSELNSSYRSENTSNSWLEDDLKSTKTVETDRKDGLTFSINRKYKGFVCLNSSSYMAGLRDMWETNSTCTNAIGREFTSQAHNDGKIEFIAYRNEFSLAFERCCRSGARITQGSGPFQIILKQAQESQITHMQIDGQSIRIQNLKSIKIAKTDSIPGHQINIMVNSAD